MAKKNAYLDQWRAKVNAAFDVGFNWGREACWDGVQIALHQGFGWGAERLNKLNVLSGTICGEIMEGFEKRVDADVTRAHIDNVLEEIYGPEFIPWEDRYVGWTEGSVERERNWKG